MPTYNSETYEDYVDLIESMDTVIAAMRSFASMLEYSLRAGEDMSNDGYGAQQLLDLQCRHLDGISTALRKEIHEIRASKLAIRNHGDIASMIGVPITVVNRVLSCALGISPQALEQEVGNATV